MKSLLSAFAASVMALAASAQTPDVRIHTDIYAKDGPTNAFTLTLGAAPGASGYADVRCSGGNQAEAEIISAYYNSSTGSLVGSNIPCKVDAEGIVEVFCDPGVVIDYISCDGAEITSIEVKTPSTIEILSLEHNKLTSLDLSAFTALQALYLSDNPFDVAPLIVGPGKPQLQVLDLSIIDNLDPNFDIKYYPSLVSFDAMSTHSLTTVTPSFCPRLQKLSIDNTNVASLDVSHNPELLILNISETRIPSIDLSANTKLQQLYATHYSAYNTDVKLTELDVTHCPDLFYLYATGNNISSIDLSNNLILQDLYLGNNQLEGINIDANTNLLNVFLQKNNMDFNTLPVPRDYWGDYDLRQRPLKVPHSVLVDTPLDLSARVHRTDSQTLATLFTSSESNPGLYSELPETAYKYENGVITFLEVPTDSVFASFFNPTFPDMELTTTFFKVKDATTFGQDDKVITIATSLTTGKPVTMSIGMVGATPETPKTFYVDLGNGVKEPFTTTTSSIPATPNVDTTKPRFGSMIVYVPEGEKISALKIEGYKINSIDLSACHQLEELSLINTQLTRIDLQWNRRLHSLELVGNKFGDGLSLAGANGGYGKNFLQRIILKNNQMTAVTFPEAPGWRYIDVSDNSLTTLNFTDAESLEYLDISRNKFETLKINYCAALETLLCTDNQLDSIFLPEEFNIRHMDFSGNRFTLKNMPVRHGLSEEHYLYAPQASIGIPGKGPGYNLSDQVIDIDGVTTQFVWKDAEGNLLTPGVDYTIANGVTHFDDSTIGRTVHCEISHAAYPAFTGENVLRTTEMLSAGMPTHLLGSFVTERSGDHPRLAVASLTENNALYIDWSGTSTLDQYPMHTTYTAYYPETVEGALVKVWSYDENDNLSVFSLSGTPLSHVDLSPMTNLVCLTLVDAGLEEIVMPASPNLAELSLDGNEFSEFDFQGYPKLSFLSMARNKFTDLDLTEIPSLTSVNFANNLIRNIAFNNPKLWSLSLTGNRIENIDLSRVPALYQVFLNDNLLSHIDLDMLSQLRVVYLDQNRFDFNTLPLPRTQWTLYAYGNQPEIKIESGHTIDLSYLSEREGVPTEFIWFYDYPTIDPDSGEISGEELIENDEYTIFNGITTFHADIDRAVCVLRHPLFPKMYLITSPVSTQISAVDEVIEAVDAPVEYFTIGGRRVSGSDLTPGFYIRRQGSDTSKVIVR